MDCLDRTNVIQSCIAKELVEKQLVNIGIKLKDEESPEFSEELVDFFNHCWANNGDAVSFLYTGTSALKGDFTRYLGTLLW